MQKILEKIGPITNEDELKGSMKPFHEKEQEIIREDTKAYSSGGLNLSTMPRWDKLEEVSSTNKQHDKKQDPLRPSPF